MDINCKDIKEFLKNNISITYVFNKYYHGNYKSGQHNICPLHDDHNPSLEISKDNKRYKCWGCGKTGDIFNLTAEHYGLDIKKDFKKILRNLSKDFGFNNKTSTNSIETNKNPIYLFKEIEKYSNVKEYPEDLTNRGITEETLRNMKVRIKNNNFYVFPYYTKNNELHSIKYISHDKKNTFYSPKGQTTILYNLQSLNKYDKNKPLIIAEGEKDTLCLISQGFQAVGLPGAKLYKKEFDPLFKDFNVIIMLDNDSAGDEGTRKIINSNIYNYAKTVQIGSIRSLLDKNKSDVCDLFQKNPEEFKNNINHLIESSYKAKEIKNIQKKTINYENLNLDENKAFIFATELNDLKRVYKNQIISNYIIHKLKENGEFYKTDNEIYYYFDKIDYVLYIIGSDLFSIYLNDKFGLNSALSSYKYVIQDLRTKTGKHGIKTTIYDTVYYLQDKNIIYLFDNDNHIYKITAENTTKEVNGIDGVLFLKDIRKEKIIIDLEKDLTEQEQEDLLNIIFDNPNYSNNNELSDNAGLSKLEQKELFTYWFYSLFFPELFYSKPILAIVGDKGSGKTLSLKLIRELFYGKNKCVLYQITEKEDDANNYLINNYLVFIDNFDQKIKGRIGWTLDWLATLATGREISKRKLFTDTEQISYNVRCFTAITSRTPDFRRDDISERLLIIDVDKISTGTLSETSIHKKLEEHKSNIWKAVIIKLQEILKALSKGIDTESNHRLADFYVFVSTIEKYKNPDDIYKTEMIFDKLTGRQSEFTLSENPLYNAIKEWFEQNDKDELNGNAKSILDKLNKIDPNLSLNTNSFGQQFKTIRHELNHFFNVSIEKERNKNYYTISQK